MIIRFVMLLFIISLAQSGLALPLQNLKLPKNYTISIYAKVPGARSMAIAKDGTVYVGTRRLGVVYAVIPNKNFTQAKRVIILARHLDQPNGIALHHGDLYVAEVSRIIKFKDIAKNLQSPSYDLVTADLPTNRHHGWRYMRFGPDGWLYIAIGAPCNICQRKDPRFATIMRMKADGSQAQIYSKVVRNSVGFAWNPADKQFWFTDNGRDWLGDNLPPDELNFAPRADMNFGFPYFYGNNIPDPKFGLGKSSKGMTPAAMDLGPHVAALGMTFYHGNILIAEHGSWNRSKKIGYRITKVELKNNKAVSYKPFIEGWLVGQKYWGRPVDIHVYKKDSILISDDYAGVIYRLAKK